MNKNFTSLIFASVIFVLILIWKRKKFIYQTYDWMVHWSPCWLLVLLPTLQPGLLRHHHFPLHQSHISGTTYHKIICSMDLLRRVLYYCGIEQNSLLTFLQEWPVINDNKIIQQLIKGCQLKNVPMDWRQWPISLRGAGIQKSWRSMTLKMKNKVGHTNSTILNSCSFQRYRLLFVKASSNFLTHPLF